MEWTQDVETPWPQRRINGRPPLETEGQLSGEFYLPAKIPPPIVKIFPVSSRWSTLLFFLLFIRPSLSFLLSALVARRQYSASHSPSFKLSYWLLPLFLLLLLLSSPLFFCRLFFDDYTWPKGKSYRTTDNYIFRHARLLWRIMGEWVFLEKSWGDSRWRGIFHEGVTRVNNWLLVVSRSKGSQRRGRDWWDSSVLHDTVL